MKTVTPLLFHRVNVEDLSVLVRVALEGEVVVHPPEGHLVVEGNDTGVFDPGLRRLLQEARALLIVDRRESFLHERLFRMPGVTHVRSSVVLKEIKSETRLPFEVPRAAASRRKKA